MKQEDITLRSVFDAVRWEAIVLVRVCLGGDWLEMWIWVHMDAHRKTGV